MNAAFKLGNYEFAGSRFTDAASKAARIVLPCHHAPGLQAIDEQYLSISYSESLSEAGIQPSVGSRGDSYDNSLAHTINRLYKAELVHRRGHGRPGNPRNWPPYNGCDGSTSPDCLIRLA